MNEARKHWLKVGFSFLALGGVLFVLRDRLHEVPGALKRASPTAVLASTVLNVLGSILLPAVMTQLALKTERLRLPLLDLVRMNFILRFYSLVLPKGGVLAMRWNMYRRGGSGGDAFALVVFEKVVMVFAYILPAAICLALEQPNLGAVGHSLLILAVAISLVSFGTILPFFHERAVRPIRWLLHKVRGRLKPNLTTRLETVIDGIEAYSRLNARHLLQLSVASLVGCLLFVLSAYVLARGMDLGLSLTAVGWMRTLTFVLTLAPITVGGIGIREISYVAFMRLYGVPQATALVYGLLLFSIQVALGLIGFTLELLQRRQASKNGAELARVESTRATSGEA